MPIARITVERRHGYTVIANDVLDDTHLSPRGCGLVVLAKSLPPDWHLSVRGLSKIISDGIHSINSAIDELKKLGYLKVYNVGRGANAKKIYAFYSRPQKGTKARAEADQPEEVNFDVLAAGLKGTQNTLVFSPDEGEKRYTIINNTILRDHSLSLKEIGVLAHLMRLSESSKITTYSLAKRMAASEGSIKTTLQSLKEKGYVITRMLSEQGRFSGVEYIVYDEPKKKTKMQNSAECANLDLEGQKEQDKHVRIHASRYENHTEEENEGKPCNSNGFSEFDSTQDAPSVCANLPLAGNSRTLEECEDSPLAGNPLAGNPLAGNQARVITGTVITPYSDNLSIYPSEAVTKEKSDGMIGQREKFMFEAVARRVSLAELKIMYPSNAQMYEEVVRLIAEVLSTQDAPKYKIGGSYVSAEAVKERFRLLTATHIDAVVFSLTSTDRQIHNIKAYIIAMLYNAPTTTELALAAQVSADSADFGY